MNSLPTRQPIPFTGQQILDREFLEMRAKILELAASFDRMGRAAGGAKGTASSLPPDARCELLRRGLQVVLGAEGTDRAEQIQLIFSREYDPDWRNMLDVPLE